ncbi:hypothetical protein UB46_41585 [Burkholderiaceae bacterium 16]|nr:hypothetical protein UB46_41585 [Burkholderiaceae bacterium 16]
MKFISIDDIPLANLLASIESRYPEPARGRWQAALDFIYRLITCELADITCVGEIEENLTVLFESLATCPPLQLEPGYWLELQIYGTEKCVDLINRHHIEWDSSLNPAFAQELEKIFDRYGVDLVKSPLIPIRA